MKNALITGAAAVVVSDVGHSMLPASIAGPIGDILLSIAGAYIGEKVTGGASLGHAVMSGVAAYASVTFVAPIIAKAVPLPNLSVGPVNVVRAAMGGLGVWAAGKVGLEKKE